MRSNHNANGVKVRRERFIALCREGKSREFIAGEMCVSIDHVRDYSAQLGLKHPHSECARVVAPKAPAPAKSPLSAAPGWTDERVSQLRLLWADLSLSASQIATRLGGDITRNSVIGKVHRLGLPARAPRGHKGGARGGARDTQKDAEKRLKRVEAAQKLEAAEASRKAAIAAALERQREEEARLAALEAVKVVAPEPIAPIAPIAVVSPRPAEVPKLLKTIRLEPRVGITIFELQNPNRERGIVGTCRWPLGEPKAFAARFCGEPPLPGRPYCSCHCRLAFSSMRPKRAATPPVDGRRLSGGTQLDRVFGAHTV
jgi:GcrA cell cycle regulator